MPLTIDQLREELSALPPDQLSELINSVQHPTESLPTPLHPSWTAELDRRMVAFQHDPSRGVPWEEIEQELHDLVDRP